MINAALTQSSFNEKHLPVTHGENVYAINNCLPDWLISIGRWGVQNHGQAPSAIVSIIIASARSTLKTEP